MVKEGDKAPAFNLPDQSGERHKLSDYKGKWVVLFAYPKANTSGWTKEAVAFTGLVKQFSKLGAVVLGISPDSVEAQKKFEAKHKLKVPLLSDDDRAVTTAYGCFGEKKMYGRTVQGITRTTYLIDPKGRIAQVWSNVRVDGHADKVLAELQSRQ